MLTVIWNISRQKSPKFADKKGNIDHAKLDDLLPWPENFRLNATSHADNGVDYFFDIWRMVFLLCSFRTPLAISALYCDILYLQEKEGNERVKMMWLNAF